MSTILVEPVAAPALSAPECLTALGDTVEEVAESLVRAGVKGEPCRPQDCPVANYLYQLGFSWVRVGTSSFSTEHGSGRYEVVNPPAVTDFIYAFDHGHFTQLCRGGRRPRRLVWGYARSVTRGVDDGQDRDEAVVEADENAAFDRRQLPAGR